MSIIYEHLFLLGNVSVISIFATAILCYGLLIDLCFIDHHDEEWFERTLFWTTGLKQMLTALPLLGLFGTITGLLSTFKSMSVERGLDIQEMITGGIAEAMFTTQLGLVMVIPGLLMLNLLNIQKRGWKIRQAHEINH